MPEGSWKCEKCNNINYPFRTKCNRQNCGADKPAESNKSPSPTPDENNQVCGVAYILCIFICCLKLSPSLIRTSVRITNAMKIQFHIFVGPLQYLLLQHHQLPSPLLLSTYPPKTLPSGFSNIVLFLIYCLIASVNLHLCTVPVSTRTCLRVEKVQSRRPALLNVGVWKSVMSSSSCSCGCWVTLPSRDLCQVVVLTLMVFEVSLNGSDAFMCQPVWSGKDLQVGFGFCS